MTYEKTPIKPTAKDKQTLFELNSISSGRIVWFLVKRHKFGLMTTWAAIMTLLFAVPTLPTMIVSLWS